MPVWLQLHPVFGHMLIASAIGVPLLLAIGILVPIYRRWVFPLTPLAALPALLLSVSAPVSVRWESLLLGTSLATGGWHNMWLFFTSVLWLASGWFGLYYLAHDEKRYRYSFFFLGAMSGNIGLVLARDPISFFASFAIMSFLSYGLIIHDGKPASLRAGRVYLALAVAGEVMQFAAMSMVYFPMVGNLEPLLFQALDKYPPPGTLATGLFIAGFGIKAGLLGLHVWLPMAHPVAPTPASAVLSGSMIKAGLLGWLTMLPVGRLAMPDVSLVMIVVGLSGAFITAIIGSLQSHPKAVLAYSSVSQMGLMATAIGVALGAPDVAPLIYSAVALFAAHHAFAKCLLFLSVGLKSSRPLERWESHVFWTGTLLAGFALIGLPFTSGALAKAMVKEVIETSMLAHADWLVVILTASAVGTTCLMLRYWATLRSISYDAHHKTSAGVWIPWLLLLFFIIAFIVLFGIWYPIHPYASPVLTFKLKEVVAPVLGVLIFTGVIALWKIARWRPITVETGDVYHPAATLVRTSASAVMCIAIRIRQTLARPHTSWNNWLNHVINRTTNQLAHSEVRLTGLKTGGLVATVMAVIVFWLALQ